MHHFTPSGTWAHFLRHVPRRPYAADDPRRGIQPMRKIEALECAHVQPQGSAVRAALLLDIDRPDTLTALREMDYPAPNLAMLNRENGHGHAVWLLAEPVTFTPAARRAPQRAFRDLQRQLSTLYGADPAYGGFLVKTPYHARWDTQELAPTLYGLTELLDAMPAGIAAQARQRQEQVAQGEGRHQTLFHVGRLWAYGQVKAARRTGSPEAWEQAVLRELTRLNGFDSPLPASEVRSLARAVARWTWIRAEHLTAPDKRSAVRSWKREELSAEEARERMSEAGKESAVRTNAIRRNRTFDAITAAQAVLAAQGIVNPTTAQLARQSGLSERSVRSFRARASSGMQADQSLA